MHHCSDVRINGTNRKWFSCFPELAFSHSIICEILRAYLFISIHSHSQKGKRIIKKKSYQNWSWRSIPWWKIQEASVFSKISWKWWVHGALVFRQSDVSGGSRQIINAVKGCCWFSFRRCWFWLWLRQWRRRWWWWQGWGCNGWLDNGAGGLLHWHSFRFWARHGFGLGATYAVLVITYCPTGTSTQVSTPKHFPSEQPLSHGSSMQFNTFYLKPWTWRATTM